MKLIIFYLTSDARHYTFPHFVKLLDKSEKKDDWSLLVLTHSNDTSYYSEELKKVSIHNNILQTQVHDNYMIKVKLACQVAEQKGIPYMMKCDNDIFLNAKTLDYMIDHLDILNNGKHLTLGPTLSSGIPGVEYFTRDFLTETQKNTLESMYIMTKFSYTCGADYTFLNKHTIESNAWDSKEFFTSVSEWNHYYKGIHPIRINYDAIKYLNECILENKDKLFTSIPTDIITDDTAPYLCDSVFCIRTDTYKSIIYNQSLFVDSYDEVPLNKYAVFNNMNHAFVKNGFGVHILYNWYDNLPSYENAFCKTLFSD